MPRSITSACREADFSTTEIVLLLSAAFEAEHDVILHHDRLALWRLMEAADQARASLLQAASVTVSLRYIHGDKHLDVCVTGAALLERRQ